LDWASERDGGNVSFRRAAEAFEWAWDRAGLSGRANLRYFREAMHALGHFDVDHAGQKLWAAPTVLSRLPAAASIRVLAGGRPTRLIEALRDGETEHPVSQDASEFLAEMMLDVRSQRFDGIPYSPDAYFLRLEVENSRVLQGARDLGVHPTKSFGESVLNSVMDLEDRWEVSPPVEQVPGARYWIWAPIPPGAEQRGRWKPLITLPKDGTHFIKCVIGRKIHYAWHQAATGAIREVGWAYGRWMYEKSRDTTYLVLHREASSRLLVSASMPIPSEVRKALVSFTGLMPRRIRVEGVKLALPRRPTHDYWAFENVSPRMAARARAILGQPHLIFVDTAAFDKERNPIN